MAGKTNKTPEEQLAAMPVKKDPLTPKQRKFVQNYLINGGNATKAALDAGYSKKTAYASGKENLHKPLIAAAIDAEKAKSAKKYNITRERVVEMILDVAENGEHEANRLKAIDMLGKYTGIYEIDNAQQKPDAVQSLTKVYVNA